MNQQNRDLWRRGIGLFALIVLLLSVTACAEGTFPGLPSGDVDTTTQEAENGNGGNQSGTDDAIVETVTETDENGNVVVVEVTASTQEDEQPTCETSGEGELAQESSNEGETTTSNLENTTQKGSEGTTQKGSEGTTQKGTEGTTQKGSEGTTQKGTESTTQKGSEGTTQKPTEGSTQKSTEGTTQKTTQSTTQATTQATTTAPTQSATQATTAYVSGGFVSKGKTVEQYRSDFGALYLNSDSSVMTQSDLDTIRSVISSNEMYTGSTAEQILKVHDWMVKTIAYDTSFTRYDIHNAIAEGWTVCQGYGETFYVFMCELGIPCMMIVGTADNGTGPQSHMWNAVEVDGAWYYLDATWDDPLCGGTSNYADGSNLSYEYFLVTYAEISGDHYASSALPSNNGTSGAYHQVAADALVERQFQAKITELTNAGYTTYRVSTAEEAYNAGMAGFANGSPKFAVLYDSRNISYEEVSQQVSNAFYASSVNMGVSFYWSSCTGYADTTAYYIAVTPSN